ncbi:MAG: hypothetical protein ABH872_06075 [Candidatus Omnitrophota bacterium]
MKKKKVYQKPQLTKIKLLLEEAVLTGCKTTSGVGGKSDRCPPVTSGCKTTQGS